MAMMRLAELAEKLSGALSGSGDVEIRGVATLESAGADQVSFLANTRYEKYLSSTQAAAVIVASDYNGPAPEDLVLIRCSDPYFAFRQAMVLFHGFRQPGFEGIDPKASVDPSVQLGNNVRVGPFAVLSAGCQIGSGTVIYPGVYIGPDCRLGENCLIYPNVTLYNGTILADRVTIHAGSSIGHDGFGYATHAGDDGVVRHEKIPQAGWVSIESDVEIGACCTIDRATIGATIIGQGTKFSNLVAIGHGTRMGKHCLMVAQAGIAGSVMVGDYCAFAGQCGVVGHVRIGHGVRVGAKAGITNDVKDGQEVLGSPAVPLTEAKRAIISTARLPQLRTTVQQLARQIQTIRQKLGLKGQETDVPSNDAKEEDA